MRLQLKRTSTLLAAAVLTLAATPARADGTLAARAAYYKERSTRVMQPMLDGMFDVGSRGTVSAHFLVDAITSASVGSGAAATTAFTERRYQAGGGYAHEFDGLSAMGWLNKLRLAGDAKFSIEPDYSSWYGGARVEADVAQRNAILALGGGVAKDSISNTGAQNPLSSPQIQCNAAFTVLAETCALTSYSGFASASQVLSKTVLVGVSYDIARLDGYQANPYRQVITAGGLVPEQHPNHRLRHAIAASGKFHIPATHTTVIGAYRYYRDDWQIRAHTPELRLVQEVSPLADASIRYRYYRQTAAFFSRPRYPTPDPTMPTYMTDDPKMSGYDGHLLEAKLGALGELFGLGGQWTAMRFETTLQYVIQHNRFGNAIVAHVALTVPLTY
jgi:hypothetical protein